MSLLSECNAHCEVAEGLTMPRPGKLNRGLSQCGRRGGGRVLATCEQFLEFEKMGTETVL